MSVQNLKIPENTVYSPLLVGFIGLLASRKGVFSLICLLVSAALAFMGKLTIPFATVMGSIQLIFCTTHAFVNSVGITNSVAAIQQLKDQVKEKL